jgi:cutinase
MTAVPPSVPPLQRLRQPRLGPAVLVLAVTLVAAPAVSLLPLRTGTDTGPGSQGHPPIRSVALTGAGRAAGPADCPDVEAIFARGTGERPGLGSVGRPFTRSLAAALPRSRVTATAVDYAADVSQASAGPGSADLVDKLTGTARRCPGTRFVVGGYSQGATVTDLALGIRVASARGTEIPADLLDRVAAVVVFGNPLGLRGATIAEENPDVADRTLEFCNDGDVVCTGRGGLLAHVAYPANGDTAEGARFAAGRVTAAADERAVAATTRKARD